ncbi:hypothetical protein [Caudoviricetes sp.]|nr:hypothetical protein [Caudoviricetes sp.]
MLQNCAELWHFYLGNFSIVSFSIHNDQNAKLCFLLGYARPHPTKEDPHVCW